MKKYGFPVLIDATHSVQRPGGNGASTGGKREYAEYIARAAIAVDADGLFMEVHPDPESALSDGSNMVKLQEFKPMLKRLLEIHDTVSKFEKE